MIPEDIGAVVGLVFLIGAVSATKKDTGKVGRKRLRRMAAEKLRREELEETGAAVRVPRGDHR